MATITKIDFPKIFDVGSQVGFTLSDGSHYEGAICKTINYFISIIGEINSLIFSKLGIIDRYKYVENIVGYDIGGGWPYVRTLEDLKKVLYALEKYNPDRIPEDKKVIISDDVEKRPFTLKVRNKRTILLNFNL